MRGGGWSAVESSLTQVPAVREDQPDSGGRGLGTRAAGAAAGTSPGSWRRANAGLPGCRGAVAPFRSSSTSGRRGAGRAGWSARCWTSWRVERAGKFKLVKVDVDSVPGAVPDGSTSRPSRRCFVIKDGAVAARQAGAPPVGGPPQLARRRAVRNAGVTTRRRHLPARRSRLLCPACLSRLLVPTARPNCTDAEMEDAMTEILRYEVGSGTVLVEVEDNSFGVERPARNEQGILRTPGGGWKMRSPPASGRRPTRRRRSSRKSAPERLELQFPVKLAGEAGAIIAQELLRGPLHRHSCPSLRRPGRAPGTGGRNHAVNRLNFFFFFFFF